MNSESDVARVFRLWAEISMMILDGRRDAAAVAKMLKGIYDQPNPPWIVDDEGNIHLILTSNGFTAEQWEKPLKQRGWQINPCARQALSCAKGAPTKGVVYHIVIRLGKLISEDDRITNKMRTQAAEKGWKAPHWEAICLFLSNISVEQLRKLGLKKVVVMHEPIVDPDGNTCLLGVTLDDTGGWLDAFSVSPTSAWGSGGGYAFEKTLTTPSSCSL